jgi:predicted RNA binding protein YcfA (HicA-like mRNA interferase family)
MTPPRIGNISLRLFLKYLESQGCKLDRTKGGHLHFKKVGARRTIVIQSHVDPVPEHVVRNTLQLLEVSRVDFLAAIEKL